MSLCHLENSASFREVPTTAAQIWRCGITRGSLCIPSYQWLSGMALRALRRRRTLAHCASPTFLLLHLRPVVLRPVVATFANESLPLMTSACTANYCGCIVVAFQHPQRLIQLIGGRSWITGALVHKSDNARCYAHITTNCPARSPPALNGSSSALELPLHSQRWQKFTQAQGTLQFPFYYEAVHWRDHPFAYGSDLQMPGVLMNTYGGKEAAKVQLECREKLWASSSVCLKNGNSFRICPLRSL